MQVQGAALQGESDRMRFILIFFALFGVVLLGLMVHEAVHIFQGKAPVSVCWDFQQKTYMHVLHDTTSWVDFLGSNGIHYSSEDVFGKWALYSERWAGIVEDIFLVVCGFIVGAAAVYVKRR